MLVGELDRELMRARLDGERRCVRCRQVHRAGRVRWHDDIERERLALPAPPRFNATVWRIMPRAHPWQIASRARAEDDVFEARTLRIRLDTGEIPVKPCADVAVHVMIVRTLAVPYFPERRRTLREPQTEARKIRLREDRVRQVCPAEVAQHA